jgi:hypothetical protein
MVTVAADVPGLHLDDLQVAVDGAAQHEVLLLVPRPDTLVEEFAVLTSEHPRMALEVRLKCPLTGIGVDQPLQFSKGC